MIRAALKFIIALVGFSIGFTVFQLCQAFELFMSFTEVQLIFAVLFLSFSFGILFLLLADKILDAVERLIAHIERELGGYSSQDLLASSVGLIIGLILAFFVSQLIFYLKIPYISTISSVVVYILFGYVGLKLPYKRRNETEYVESALSAWSTDKRRRTHVIMPKILDTSAIIDGRIKDICMTGFMEGVLLVPEFVLQELQHIADSSDNLKRMKGRRGLDLLKEMQAELPIELKIVSDDVEESKEVDIKIIKLAQKLKAKVITTDYNLNKLAEVQGISVLNINELANVIKTVVLPKELLKVSVMKEGKEPNQGVAYMSDGTMIVIEHGKKYIGDTIQVEVTSVLQTPAGRMIFARVIEETEIQENGF